MCIAFAPTATAYSLASADWGTTAPAATCGASVPPVGPLPAPSSCFRCCSIASRPGGMDMRVMAVGAGV
jgi:hypothetical protein